jgi:hypothetical protein
MKSLEKYLNTPTSEERGLTEEPCLPPTHDVFIILMCGTEYIL